MGQRVSQYYRSPDEITAAEKQSIFGSPVLDNKPTIAHVAQAIKSGKSKRIMLLCGAGISVAAGIPDFRTPGTGLYDNLQEYGLPDDQPTAIFDIEFYRDNPNPFCRLAREMYPKADIDGNLKYKPTLTHFFIRLLQSKGLLLRCYTQNIDVLERTAGVPSSHLVECHGSFSGGHCSKCGNECDPDWLKNEFFSGKIPTCTKVLKRYKKTNKIAISQVESCDNDNNEDPTEKGKEKINTVSSVQEEEDVVVKCDGYCKPDITFFGENLPPRFHELHEDDADAADLLIVMGTSLQVAPVSSLPGLVHPLCPRLLINREPCNLSNVTGAGIDLNAYDSDSGSDEEYSTQNYGPDAGFRFNLDDNYRDIFYKGDCDAGVLHLCELLGWDQELLAMQKEFNVEDASSYAAEQDSMIRSENKGEDEEMEKTIMKDLANMDLHSK